MKISYQKELEKIKKIIKDNPRGVTIKEIAKKIGVNRNVVGKYLDVLQIGGEVEAKKFGRSHVYFPAQSVPISTMFDYTNDFIVVVRKDMTTVEINTPFIKYLGLVNKEKTIGKHIKNLPFAKEHTKITENILGALKKQQILEDDIKYKTKNGSKTDHFRAKFIPTTLNDGEQGVTVIISKITK
jgi:PAS domain S-box-containing protein